MARFHTVGTQVPLRVTWEIEPDASDDGSARLVSADVRVMFSNMQNLDRLPSSNSDAVLGARHGPFVVFTDQDGIRQAVRLSSVLAVSDMDQSQDSSLLQLPGGRAVVVRMPLDDVLSWFLDAMAAPPSRMSLEAAQASLSLANMRQVVSGIMRLLLDEGVVPAREMEALRDDCLVAADRLAQEGGPLRQACGAAAARDVRQLFQTSLRGGSGAGV